MKITLSIDSKETIELSLSYSARIVSMLNDDEQYASFFSALTQHPSSEVRQQIAYKSYSPLKTLRHLAQDSSIGVVATVACNDTALASFKLSIFREMIERDVSVAINIAENLHVVNEEIRSEVMDILLQHDDPLVAQIAYKFQSSQQEYND